MQNQAPIQITVNLHLTISCEKNGVPRLVVTDTDVVDHQNDTNEQRPAIGKTLADFTHRKENGKRFLPNLQVKVSSPKNNESNTVPVCKICNQPMKLHKEDMEESFLKRSYRCTSKHKDGVRKTVQFFCMNCGRELNREKIDNIDVLICSKCGVIASKNDK